MFIASCVANCNAVANFSQPVYYARKSTTAILKCETDSPAILMDHSVKMKPFNATERFVNVDDILVNNRVSVTKTLLESGKTLWILTKRNVMEEDGGFYSCFEQNWAPNFIISNVDDSSKFAMLSIVPNGANKLVPFAPIFIHLIVKLVT